MTDASTSTPRASQRQNWFGEGRETRVTDDIVHAGRYGERTEEPSKTTAPTGLGEWTLMYTRQGLKLTADSGAEGNQVY